MNICYWLLASDGVESTLLFSLHLYHETKIAMAVDDSKVDQQRLVIQRNNEAVIMIQRGEFNKATNQLMEALRDFRSSTSQHAGRPQPDGDDSNDGSSSFERLSLDQWMVSSTEALHTRLS